MQHRTVKYMFHYLHYRLRRGELPFLGHWGFWDSVLFPPLSSSVSVFHLSIERDGCGGGGVHISTSDSTKRTLWSWTFDSSR